MLTPEISRRSFLRLSATAALIAAGVPVLYPPKEAGAAEWVYAGKKPWQSNQWFPFDRRVAAARNIITMDGPLSTYDRLHEFFLRENSHLQPDFRRFADGYLSRRSDTEEWAGFCNGVASLSLGPKPLTEPKKFDLGNGKQLTITYQDRLGIGAAFRADDAGLRDLDVSVSVNLDRFISRFLAGDRQAFIINASLGKPGVWYRAVYGVNPDGSALLATNFNAPGAEWVIVPKEKVQGVFESIPWKVAQARGVDNRFLVETSPELRYHDRMNEPLVNHILYGQPFDAQPRLGSVDKQAGMTQLLKDYGLQLGVDAIGYRISDGWLAPDGFDYMAYQGAILQLEPKSGKINLWNTLDQMHDLGLDARLDNGSLGVTIPPYEDFNDGSKGDLNRAFRNRLERFGIPSNIAAWVNNFREKFETGVFTSGGKKYGPYTVYRLQRMAVQDWNNGSIQRILVGDAAKNAGLIPQGVLLARPDTNV